MHLKAISSKGMKLSIKIAQFDGCNNKGLQKQALRNQPAVSNA
jgi:hypothetical protein